MKHAQDMEEYALHMLPLVQGKRCVEKEAAKEEEEEELPTDKALASAAGLIPPKRLKYDAEAKIVFTESRKADVSVFEPLIAEEHKMKSCYFIPPDDLPVEESTEDKQG